MGQVTERRTKWALPDGRPFGRVRFIAGQWPPALPDPDKEETMDIQKMLDAISENARATRSLYHLTLGQLVAALKEASAREAMPRDAQVVFSDGTNPGNGYSYRGYYSDLAFHRAEGRAFVREFLDYCEGLVGANVTGYKGGNYTLQEDTPIWCAEWGEDSDTAVVAVDIRDPGRVVLELRQLRSL